MNRIKKDYQAPKDPEFVMIDDLPLLKIGSELKQAYKKEGNGDIQIKLEYKGSQVVRTAKANAPKLDIHHLAIEYLMDVLDQQVERFEDFSLTYEGNEIHFRGFIDEIPVYKGLVVKAGLVCT